MKRAIKTFIIAVVAITMCSCGEDRSAEFFELTKENQWIYAKMKEVYLWRDSIADVNQRTYFSNTSKFFTTILNKSDDASFFTDSIEPTSYGFHFSLMRDPLKITPARVYALVEYVEPASPAAIAGLKRGMWISSVNGNLINMGSNATLSNGEAKTFGVHRIAFDDENEKYVWQEMASIEIGAATKKSIAPLPITTTISDMSGKTGYILCNSFDNENCAGELENILSAFVADGVSNIVLDLRYNNSLSLQNAATVAAMFVPTDKQGGIFCTIYKDLKLETREDILISQATTSVSNIPLYIITTANTTGAANAFIKAVRIARGTSALRIVGTSATCTPLITENFVSPYLFEINPATALIYDAMGEPLAATTPDYLLNEHNDYKHIYPLGDKQEYLLYNITYIIANQAAM